MNPKFFDVKKEKQDAIINAALMVFAENGYKKASTDVIVKEAGISKGLLFHYFESKKGVYEFVYDYSIKYTMIELNQTVKKDETDFFSIQRMIELTKTRVMKNYPYMQQFLSSVRYETHPDALKVIKDSEHVVDDAYRGIYNKADMSKFKRGVDQKKIISMIGWMSDGFIKDKFREGTPDLDEMNAEFAEYLVMIRDHFYKVSDGMALTLSNEMEIERDDSVMDSMREEISSAIQAAPKEAFKPRELTFEERLALGKKSVYGEDLKAEDKPADRDEPEEKPEDMVEEAEVTEETEETITENSGTEAVETAEETAGEEASAEEETEGEDAVETAAEDSEETDKEETVEAASGEEDKEEASIEEDKEAEVTEEETAVTEEPDTETEAEEASEASEAESKETPEEETAGEALEEADKEETAAEVSSETDKEETVEAVSEEEEKEAEAAKEETAVTEEPEAEAEEAAEVSEEDSKESTEETSEAESEEAVSEEETVTEDKETAEASEEESKETTEDVTEPAEEKAGESEEAPEDTADKEVIWKEADTDGGAGRTGKGTGKGDKSEKSGAVLTDAVTISMDYFEGGYKSYDGSKVILSDMTYSASSTVTSYIPVTDLSFFEESRLSDFSYGADERGGRGIPADSSNNVQIFFTDDFDEGEELSDDQIDISDLSEKIMNSTSRETQMAERDAELKSMGPAPVLPDFSPDNLKKRDVSLDDDDEDRHIYRPTKF